ncbi:PREDICTED: uncharacterized protein LOC106811186 isoform X2 [Priapulus caudatus]|uniref:Nucleoporin NUP42 n=1 Tax=Priapulus caudatus TaxID=37621 RepID=A0ABM1EDX7_PRICU|nr:PREDICTED: uncharacterized protein LOC106811186 isoform X2 [Priapulus caudatus]
MAEALAIEGDAPGNNDNDEPGSPVLLADPNVGQATQADPSSKASSTAKGACRHFTAHGKCRFGKHCRYPHIKAEPSLDEARAVFWNSEETLPLDTTHAHVGTDSLHSPAQEEENVSDDSPAVRNPNNSGSNKTRGVCKIFSQSGKCRFGSDCRYSHMTTDGLNRDGSMPLKKCKREQEKKSNDGVVASSDQVGVEVASSVKVKSGSRMNEKDKKLCRYFQRGRCYSGQRCAFLHKRPPSYIEKESQKDVPAVREQPESSVESVEGKPVSEAPTIEVETPAMQQMDACEVHPPQMEGDHARHDQAARPISKRQELHIQDLTEEDFTNLRKTEITQLLKHFPKGRLAVEEMGGGRTYYRLQISPTDPDWPYDMQVVELLLWFPDDYPRKEFNVEILPDLQGEQQMPTLTARYMTDKVQQWLSERVLTNQETGKVELILRLFLRWFDRSLEDLVTQGLKQVKLDMDAKAAGIEAVPWQKLVGSQSTDTGAISQSQEEDDEKHLSDGTAPSAEGGDWRREGHVAILAGNRDDNSRTEDKVHMDLEQKSGRSEKENMRPLTKADTMPKGTQVKLSRFELSETVATIIIQKVVLVLRCARCKGQQPLSTPARRKNVITCQKCSQQLIAVFRPSIVHQYSPVLGHLDLDNCVPFDMVLVDCEFLLCCLECSKQMTISGLHFGQNKDTWCHHCHTKMTVMFETVKYQKLQPGEITGEGPVHTVGPKKQKKPTDVIIKEGQPLPDNGTCKHYKKSFRWLRFPCCGKCYPCDVCHEEKEDGHEMKFASRMICGYCCKEQAYSRDKPCVACKGAVTKHTGIYWEGGKGCRDKVKMSRNDAQKFSDTNKTISRKQQELSKKKSGKK